MTEYQNNNFRKEYNVADKQLPDLVGLVLDEKWIIPSYAVNFIMSVNKKIEQAKSFDLFAASISDSNYEEENLEGENTFMPYHIVSALSESPSLAAHDIQHNICSVNQQSPVTAPEILVEDIM
jgi:hypothetical protein